MPGHLPGHCQHLVLAVYEAQIIVHLMISCECVSVQTLKFPSVVID